MISLASPAWLTVGLLLCLPYLLRPRRAWQYSSLYLLPANSGLDVVMVVTFGISVVALALLVIGLARPQKLIPSSQPLLQARDIVLTLDLSLSMEGHIPTHQAGRYPQRKLDLVQRAAREFVQRHHSDRLALIVFGDEAFGVWPLSNDSKTMLRRLQHLDSLIPAQLRGTHVEKALLKSLEHMQELGQASSQIILLLTDGLDTIEPGRAEQILQRLQRDNIKLYVLGIQLNENSSVARLARRAPGGGYYAIDQAEEMDRALTAIDQLETSHMSIPQVSEVAELYPYFVVPGLVFLFLVMVCKSVWVMEV